jgi:colicin import membrane protein
VTTVQQRWYSPAFAASVILHVAVLMLLIVSFEFTSQMAVLENINNDSKIISAVAMNLPMKSSEPAPPPVQKAAPKPKPVVAAPPKPKPAPVPPPPLLANEADQLEKQIEAEQAIALKKEEHKNDLAQKQAAIEKQLLADLKKQKVKTTKAKQKALEQAMEKEIKQQAENALQQQLLHEEKRASGAKSQGIVNKYKALILQAIGERWLVPTGVDKKLYSELLIRVAPGGVVLDVQVTRSSGDVSLDKSARDAVFKASPLPVPEDTAEFNQFRQFVLKVKPENIVTSDA